MGVASRAFTARLERLLLIAAIAGLVSAIVAIILQGAVGEGSSFWSAAQPNTFSEVLGTRFGTAWGVGALAWVLVLIVLATRPLRGRDIAPPPQAPEPVLVVAGGPPEPARAAAAAPAAPALSTPKLAALAVPLFGLALLPSLGGHTSVQKPVAVLLPANIVHVLAMSAWLGGVAVLVFALRAATAELEPDARTPLLAGVVGRFSALATIALPLLILSGVVQSIVEVGSFGALLDSAFGRAVLIKIVVALAIVVLGFFNRQRMLPALRRATTPGRTGVLLRRTLRAELALGVVAIAVTGALSSYAPSVAESSGPYATSVMVGPARVEVTVDPGQGRPQPASPVPVRRQDRRAVRADRGTDRQRRDARKADRQDRAVTARRRPRPLRGRRRQLRRGGRVDHPHGHPRLRLRPVRDPLPGADLMMRRTLLLAALVAAGVPATAQAHVTLQPNTAPAGQFTRLDVRVPNERDDAPTTKVDVQMPDGFASVSYEPVPGWTVKVTSGPLDQPIQTDDGEITEGVKQITWTADSDDDGIPPGAFQDFGLSFQVPGKAGDKLEFKALQTYAGGEVVRWIGAEGSDNPAAIVSVVEPQGTDAASHSGGGEDASEEATPAATTVAATSEDGSGNGLAIVALIVGVLGLIAGVAGLLAARRG